jgi:hypothetical protein
MALIKQNNGNIGFKDYIGILFWPYDIARTSTGAAEGTQKKGGNSRIAKKECSESKMGGLARLLRWSEYLKNGPISHVTTPNPQVIAPYHLLCPPPLSLSLASAT